MDLENSSPTIIKRGRKVGSKNGKDKYMVEFLHPLHKDVVIQCKKYKSYGEISKDTGYSEDQIYRFIKNRRFQGNMKISKIQI